MEIRLTGAVVKLMDIKARERSSRDSMDNSLEERKPIFSSWWNTRGGLMYCQNTWKQSFVLQEEDDASLAELRSGLPKAALKSLTGFPQSLSLSQGLECQWFTCEVFSRSTSREVEKCNKEGKLTSRRFSSKALYYGIQRGSRFHKHFWFPHSWEELALTRRGVCLARS